MTLNSVIFDDKTLSDMFADVYKNTEQKRNQINEFVSRMVKLIRTPEDATVLGPVIQGFLEVNVKNDEHIVRLVQIAQRLVQVSAKTAPTGELLSEEEKQQLLKNVKMDFEQVLEEQDELQNTIDSLK